MAPRKTDDAPSGEVKDDSYVTGDTKGEAAPVISDDATIEDPIDDKVADSDAQLERDDKEAIDESNIIDERTRHAKPVDTYREPGDTEGLPEDNGRSSTSTTQQVLKA